MSRSGLGPCTRPSDTCCSALGFFPEARPLKPRPPTYPGDSRSPSPGVKRVGSGNNARVENYEEDLEASALPAAWVEGAWVEAAGVVQADQDVDLRLEARGLMVAEMAEVDLVDRLLATEPGRRIRVLLRDGTWHGGLVEFAAVDHLVLDCRPRLILPGHAICAVASLPRTLHREPAARPLWRSTLRDHLGTTIMLSIGQQAMQGRLTWVGRDHISVQRADGELTVAWAAVDSVAVTD